MKHIKRFNENHDSIEDTDPNTVYWKRDDGKKPNDGSDLSETDEVVLFALESEMTIELMDVIRPFYKEHGLELTKSYLSELLDNFNNEDFIEDFYNNDSDDYSQNDSDNS